MPIATNPKTGETVFLDQSGQWQPAKIAKNPQSGESLAFDGAAWVPIKGPEKPKSFLDTVSDTSEDFKQFTREALNTATFGLSDIVAGGGRAAAEALFGKGEGGKIAEAFKAPRKERQAFEQENPKTAIAASIAGGFVNPVAQRLGGFISGGKGTLAQIGRGAGGGAALTGAQSTGERTGEVIGNVAAGEDVNFLDKAEQVAKDTLTGGAIGGAIPGAVQAGKAGFNGVASLLTRFSDKAQGTRALRKITEALERDGFTPQQALKRVDELGPEAALLDVGDNSRGLAFIAFGIPGKGKTSIAKFLRDRQEGVRNPITGVVKGGQVQRIQEHIDDIIPDNFFTQRERLANLNNSAKLYDEAYAANQAIDDKVINGILKTPSGRQAFKNARVTLRDLQKNLARSDPELTALAKEQGVVTGAGIGKGLKLEFLDQVKRELFDLEQLAKGEFGKSTSKSGAITELRRKLIRRLDEVDVTAQSGPNSLKAEGGSYARARVLAGDKLSEQEALENGADFMLKSRFSTPQELGVALEDMTPEARHLFRVGAAQALKAKISDSVSRADATKKLFNVQGLEQKVNAAFGDQDLFASYTKFLGKEETLFRAVADVLGNSKTGERIAALDDAVLDPGRILQGFRDITSGQPGGVTRGVVNIAGGIKDRIVTPPNQSEQLAKILTGRDISQLKPLPAPQFTEPGQPRSLQELVIRALASGQSVGE